MAVVYRWKKSDPDFSSFAAAFDLCIPRCGRADGVAEAPDGSLFISESQKGRIWRVIYRRGK